MKYDHLKKNYILSICDLQHNHEQDLDKLPKKTLEFVEQLISKKNYDRDEIYSILLENNIEPKSKKQEVQLKNFYYSLKRKYC